MLALPTQALEGGELIRQNERKLRCSDGSGMLINDPLGEGSNASSYRQRALESGGLLPQMRGNLDAQKGAACS